ncbi:MAG: hypothetical protein GXP06_02830 [Alphaproteobacteria bacterium]|nr:hypothetical protein [Alphaproteobacteria bacterium]
MLVFFFGTAKRRGRLVQDAAKSRASALGRAAAWAVVIAYNIVGIIDIYSTIAALESGAGMEANPLVRTVMFHAGDGWIAAKLALQGVISFMVLWFPHWIVISFFAVASAINAGIVYNNLVIAGVL